MADLILRLRVDPVTGRREIVVDYASDSDALPIEHEEQHRALAERIVDGGLQNQKVAVSREADGTAATAAAATDVPAAAPTAAKQ